MVKNDDTQEQIELEYLVFKASPESICCTVYGDFFVSFLFTCHLMCNMDDRPILRVRLRDPDH